ncbi:sugar ABC transporter permease [Dictyoglomus thermophilum]|uniref:Maltose/maltodextrin transport system permease protein MalG n=1 Tax=Dictyoglomus thermophilum (strain ATCC 35947 / DSM 3960 / H-6-12) TaxID=309799 RepID=B5YDG5_DICT6|nr:sugar ABC transporter permease [Dictyoglomus thermophilum]ACI19693.1 maltose ABC transporter, permease protein [Dictyoglomus thermophilum H-6-12]
MVEKKTYWLTHIVLWILIPIILFPVVWVVSTSIRRDEAAFSTKIFSSRVSLQNYKDLIAPEKNMPALVQEIQNLIMLTPPYDNWDRKRIEREIERDISALKSYIEETNTRYNEVEKNYKALNDYLSLKTDNIKTSLYELIESLKEYLEKNLPKEGKEGDLSLKLSKLKKLREKIEELNSKIYQNRVKYNRFLEKLSLIQREILEIDKKINALNNEVVSLNSKFSDFSLVSYKENSYIEEAQSALISKLSRYSDFSLVTQNIKNLYQKLKYLSPKDIEYTYLQTSLFKISKELNNLIDQFDKKVVELSAYDKKIALLNQENEFLEMQKELLQGQEENIEEEVKPLTKIDKLKEFISSLDSKLNKIQMFGNLDDLVNEVSNWESEFREFVTSYIIDYGRDSLSSKIESTAEGLKWFNDYKTLKERFVSFSSYLSKNLEKASDLTSRIENKWREVFEKNLQGNRLYLSELDDLYNLIKTDFVNFVSANMNIVSKKAGDLMDIIPFKEAKKWLDRIDNGVFRIDQIWKQKTKHYFLKWVRNSILVSGIAAIITTLICSLAAYPFSRMRFWGRRYGILTLLLIQMFPSAVYMIAIYTLLNILGRFIPFLGLDTLSGLTFVYLGNIAYNMYLIKGYYDTIPDSLEESAMIDGATRFQTFYKIVLPLARPILTVVVILTFMNIFNEFIFARIILQDAQKYTYAIGLWTFSSGPYQTEWGLFTAAALLGMLPMTILFLSLQRYIVSGLTKGAVKG